MPDVQPPSPSQGVTTQLHHWLAMLASFANATCAWPSGAELAAPRLYSPRAEAHAKVNPGMYHSEVEELMRRGGILLQFIDTGEQVPVRSEDSDDLKMQQIAHTDLWAPIQTFYPHRVPVGDRIEGVSVLGRMLVAAIESAVAIAGFDTVDKLKVCCQMAVIQFRACVARTSTAMLLALTMAPPPPMCSDVRLEPALLHRRVMQVDSRRSELPKPSEPHRLLAGHSACGRSQHG